MNAQLPAWISLLIAMIPFVLAPLLMATAFRLYYAVRRTQNIWVSFVGLISFWIGYEYLHQSWDLAFPWMTLGNGFANFHQLVQWYSYTGVYGGTLWIWTVNILVFLFYWQKKHQIQAYSQKLIGLLIAALTIIPVAVSFVQYSTYEESSDPSQLVVVQPIIDPYGKAGYIAPEE